jgi:hypothetical protein
LPKHFMFHVFQEYLTIENSQNWRGPKCLNSYTCFRWRILASNVLHLCRQQLTHRVHKIRKILYHLKKNIKFVRNVLYLITCCGRVKAEFNAMTTLQY